MSCKIKCMLVLFLCICNFSVIASQDPSKIPNASFCNNNSMSEKEIRDRIDKQMIEMSKVSTSTLFSGNKAVSAQNGDKHSDSANSLKNTEENKAQKPIKEVNKENTIKTKRKLIKKSQTRQKANEAHTGENKCFENHKIVSVNNNSSKKIEGNIPPIELCRPRSQRVERSVISTTPPLDQKETRKSDTEIVMRTPGEIDMLRRIEFVLQRSERHFQWTYQQLEQIKQEQIVITKLLEHLKGIEQQQYITARLLQKLHKKPKFNEEINADKEEGKLKRNQK